MYKQGIEWTAYQFLRFLALEASGPEKGLLLSFFENKAEDLNPVALATGLSKERLADLRDALLKDTLVPVEPPGPWRIFAAAL